MWESIGWFVVGAVATIVGMALWVYAEGHPVPRLRHDLLALGPGLPFSLLPYALITRNDWLMVGVLSIFGVCLLVIFTFLFRCAYQNWKGNLNQLANS